MYFYLYIVKGEIKMALVEEYGIECQKNLLNELCYFVENPIREEEISIISEFLVKYCDLSIIDKAKLPEAMSIIGQDPKMFVFLLIEMEVDKIHDIHNIITNFRYRETKDYKKMVNTIINEIGIDELYEIINELDGKENEH